MELKDINIYKYLLTEKRIKKHTGGILSRKEDIEFVFKKTLSFSDYEAIKKDYLDQLDLNANTPEIRQQLKEELFYYLYTYTYFKNERFKAICDFYFIFFLNAHIKNKNDLEDITKDAEIVLTDIIGYDFLLNYLTLFKEGSHKNFNGIYEEYNEKYKNLKSFNMATFSTCIKEYIEEAETLTIAAKEHLLKKEEINKVIENAPREIFYSDNDIKTNYHITDTTKENEEKAERRQLNYIKDKENLKEEAEKTIKALKNKKIIEDFRKRNPDIPLTDSEILEIKLKDYNNQTSIDLIDALNLEKQGITYEQIKDKKTDNYLKIKQENVAIIMNIDNQELYKNFGENSIKIIRYIENIVLNFIQEKGINELKADTKFSINPYQFNKIYNIKNNITYTKEIIKGVLQKLLQDSYEYQNYEKNGILDTSIEKIKSKIKDIKEQEEIINLTKHKILRTTFLSNYEIITDPLTNQEIYTFTLNISRIYYYKLIYMRTRFITDKTHEIKAIKGNTKKRIISDFIKSYLLYLLKVDKRYKPYNENYTKYEWDTTIKFIKDMLLENELLNENIKKYKKTIYDPIKNALDYLKENNIIDYYTQAFSFYEKQVKENKRGYFRAFENQEITIKLLNNYD